MPIKQQYISHLLKTHPQLSNEKLDELISPQLLSPFEVELPKSILDEAQNLVKACFELRERPEYQSYLAKEIAQRGLRDPGNKAILMSYDFHVDTNGNLKLIEINTNASFLALGYEMYQMRGLPQPVHDFSIDEIRDCIDCEMKLQGKSISGKFKIAIIDEEPETQRLFTEFLVYQSYFQKWGWECEISDFRKVSDADFIYNRLTDFYLDQPESRHLREQFLNRKACISPNPFEYVLLADKQRMIDWCQEQLWDQIPGSDHLRSQIEKNLPQARDLNPETAEEIWSDRKKFFLKPKRAFGSKQSYRGGSISRKAFIESADQNFIAQEFVPAPERSFQTPDGEKSFKYDLRFFAYRGRVQSVVARLYQGQVTNLKTPFGGFAPVLFR